MLPGWVFADLELERVAAVRADGQVLNHRDWSAPGHQGLTVVRTRLG